MANEAAFEALRAHIERIRSIPGLAAKAAPEVARALQAEVLGNVSRQVGPDGKPWPPTEAGTPALQHTAKALSATAIGTRVVLQLEGVHARHHAGRVKGGKRRQILPSSELPPSMARTVAGILERRFVEHMEGA